MQIIYKHLMNDMEKEITVMEEILDCVLLHGVLEAYKYNNRLLYDRHGVNKGLISKEQYAVNWKYIRSIDDEFKDKDDQDFSGTPAKW